LVRHPAHSGAEEPVDGKAIDLLEITLDRADPQAHMVRMPDCQSEAPAVCGPAHVVDLCSIVQGQWDLGAILYSDEAEGGGTAAPVVVADHRIHPHAGKLVHRCRELGERGIDHWIGQQQVLACGRWPRHRERWSVEDLEDLLGWSLPPGAWLESTCCGNREWRSCQRRSEQRDQNAKHDSSPLLIRIAGDLR
jgi:hypothetical protein